MTDKQYTVIIGYLSLIAKGIGYILVIICNKFMDGNAVVKKYENDIDEMKQTWTS